jgi:hypothetical protein
MGMVKVVWEGVVGVADRVEGLGRDVLSAVVQYGEADAEYDSRRLTDKTWIQALKFTWERDKKEDRQTE